MPPERIEQSIDELGFGFLFAQAHHPAMKHAAPVRRELAARTVFNVLGPLTNPAGARAQVVGVYSPGHRADDRRGARPARRAARVRRARRGRDRRALAGRAEPRLRGRRAAGCASTSSTRRSSASRAATRPSCAAATPRRTRAALRDVLDGVAPGAATASAVLLNAAGAIAAAGHAADLREGLGSPAPRSTRAPPDPARRADRVLRGRRWRTMDGSRDALAAPGFGAIAEFKRRSPSAGDLRPGGDVGRGRPELRAGRGAGDVGARRRAVRRVRGTTCGPRGPRRRSRCSPRASSRPRSTCGPQPRPAPTRRCCILRDLDDATCAALMREAERARARHARRGARCRRARARRARSARR